MSRPASARSLPLSALPLLALLLCIMPDAITGKTEVTYLRSKGANLYANSYARDSCGDWTWSFSLSESNTVVQKGDQQDSTPGFPPAELYFTFFSWNGDGTYSSGLINPVGNTTADLGITVFTVTKTASSTTLVGLVQGMGYYYENYEFVRMVPVVISMSLNVVCDAGETLSGRASFLQSYPDGTVERTAFTGSSCSVLVNPAVGVSVSIDGQPLVCAPGGDPADVFGDTTFYSTTEANKTRRRVT